nr:hypothetical protein [uncultured Desulfobacter sp.]
MTTKEKIDEQNPAKDFGLGAIPTEPVGSIPRPRELQEAMEKYSQGKTIS